MQVTWSAFVEDSLLATKIINANRDAHTVKAIIITVSCCDASLCSWLDLLKPGKT